THNTARYFTEQRHISWVLLLATMAWGVYGYFHMPQRKDPDIPVRQALVLCRWPGSATEKAERLVTRQVRQQVAENSKGDRIESISRVGISIVYLKLQDSVEETGKEFDDVKLKLDGIKDLPDGAGPIVFVKDFGDTAALMLTVASPKVDSLEIAIRARAVEAAIRQVRQQFRPSGNGKRISVIYCFPQTISPVAIRHTFDLLANGGMQTGVVRDIHPIEGTGFAGIDGVSDLDDAALTTVRNEFIRDRLHASEFHPDAWQPVVIREPEETQAKLASVAGEKYSYRQLDDFTDLIKRTLQTVPQVSKITRSGLLNEQVYLNYSQERLASYG